MDGYRDTSDGPKSARSRNSEEPKSDVRDIPENKVLRRKRRLFNDALHFTENLAEHLVAEDVIDEETRDAIKVERNNHLKVNRLWNYFLGEDTEYFQQFCQALQTYDDPSLVCQWLADELRAELRWENKQQKTEEYIQYESNVIVHKEYGQSTRLSEADKKDLCVLVGARVQYMKDVWERRLTSAKTELEVERCINEQRNEHAQRLQKKLLPNIRIVKGKLRNRSTDVGTTSGLFRGDTNKTKKGGLEDLEAAINDMVDVATQCLFEKDNLEDEKTRTLLVVGNTENNTKLDEAISSAMKEREHHLSKTKGFVVEKELENKTLDQTINHLHEEHNKAMQKKAREIQGLKDHISKCVATISDLQQKVMELQTELQGTNSECDKWKRKAEILDRRQKIGFTNKEDKVAVLSGEVDGLAIEESPRKSAPSRAGMENGKSSAGGKSGRRRSSAMPGKLGLYNK